MKKTRLILPAMLAVALTWYVAAGALEARRVAQPLPKGPVVHGVDVDQAQLMKDVQTLSSPAYAGRRTGSEGSRLAQAYLATRFAEAGIAPLGANFVHPFSFTRKSVKGAITPGKSGSTAYPSAANILGQIKGTAQPERVIVVSAHYDHLGVQEGKTYFGADDNASGVGSMLAVARHFGANPPQHTIVFAAFDAEELGSHGAEAMLATLPFPRAQIKLNLNLDMVSRNDKNEIYVAGTSHTPALVPLVTEVAAGSPLTVKLGHDRPITVAGSVEDWTGSSDHRVFHAAGIPFLYFGVEDHADYHGPGDTADKIKPAFYTEATRLIVRTAAALDQRLAAISLK